MIAILYALQNEIAYFHKQIKILKQKSIDNASFYEAELKGLDENSNPLFLLVKTGMGLSNAGSAAERLLEDYKIKFIISTGFAGAIKEGIKIGDIIFSKNVLFTDGAGSFGKEESTINARVECDLNLIDLAKGACQNGGLSLHFGDTVTVKDVVSKATEKRWLGTNLNAIAVDMESIAIAEAAVNANVPFISMRSISDTIDQDLNIGGINIISKNGTIDVKKIGLKLIGDLQYLPELIRLRKQAITASHNLAIFLSSFVYKIRHYIYG